MASVYRYLDLEQLQARPHRWRFNLVTGQTTEESLSDRIMEFGMINGTVAGRPHRYTYNVTGAPGWFLFDGLVKHDLHTGHEDRYAFGDGRLRERDTVRAAGRFDRGGRRLPGHVHHGRRPRSQRVPRLRRRGPGRRPDREGRPSRAHQRRHPLVLGAQRRPAA